MGVCDTTLPVVHRPETKDGTNVEVHSGIQFAQRPVIGHAQEIEFGDCGMAALAHSHRTGAMENKPTKLGRRAFARAQARRPRRAARRVFWPQRSR